MAKAAVNGTKGNSLTDAEVGVIKPLRRAGGAFAKGGGFGNARAISTQPESSVIGIPQVNWGPAHVPIAHDQGLEFVPEAGPPFHLHQD